MVRDEIPGRLSGETIVSSTGDFIWYCIPKNASRSLSKIFAPHGRRLGDLTSDVRSAEPLLGLPRPRLTFAFVRNPYDRIVSAWRNKVFDPPDTIGQRNLFDRLEGLYRGMDLNAFVRWLDERSKANTSIGPDPHWRPQHQFVCNSAYQLCVDILGRIETFDRDLAILASELGMEIEPRHENATDRDEEDRLDDEAASIIARLYALDFELLGYDPTYSPAPATRLS